MNSKKNSGVIIYCKRESDQLGAPYFSANSNIGEAMIEACEHLSQKYPESKWTPCGYRENDVYHSID